MQIGGRTFSKAVAAAFSARHYLAAWNVLRLCDHPLDVLNRYLLQRGDYPVTVHIRTPVGRTGLTLFTPHDVLTINEIFFRLDYLADANDKIVVDFGSNIGVSAAYFLSRTPDSFAYLFEPFAPNIAKLHENLRQFHERFELQEAAVGLSNSTVEFGWEATGRYGGVGRDTGQNVQVRCIDSNEILDQVVSKRGKIDILKIDIETLEREVTNRIPVYLLRRIKKIYVEYPFHSNPLQTTHRFKRYGSVAQFINLASIE
jgi:FkbM family methyltransferase